MNGLVRVRRPERPTTYTHTPRRFRWWNRLCAGRTT